MSTQDSTGGSPFSPPQFPKSEYKPPSWPWLPPMPARYPVAVACAPEPERSGARVYVVCNDGSVWVLYDGQWYQQPAIPQPGEEGGE